jgi:hypothetical protein
MGERLVRLVPSGRSVIMPSLRVLVVLSACLTAAASVFVAMYLKE